MVKLLCVVCAREKADKIGDAIRNAGANYEHVVLAYGTARSEVLGMLGLGSSERAMLFSTVTDTKLPAVYRVLREDFAFERSGNGIAFTVPLTAAGGPASLYVLTGGERRQG